MSELVQVTTTVDSETAARAIADRLVTDRVAACVQIVGPITSIYRWQGKIEEASEWLCVAKSTARLAELVMATIRSTHPYEQPEILVTPVRESDAGYEAWVVGEVQ